MTPFMTRKSPSLEDTRGLPLWAWPSLSRGGRGPAPLLRSQTCELRLLSPTWVPHWAREWQGAWPQEGSPDWGVGPPPQAAETFTRGESGALSAAVMQFFARWQLTVSRGPPLSPPCPVPHRLWGPHSGGPALLSRPAP